MDNKTVEPVFRKEQGATRFQDETAAKRYHLRPAYPPDTFDILNSLIVDGPRVVLDVGCGTGNIARYLAKYADRIDTLDFSQSMLSYGKALPGGDSPGCIARSKILTRHTAWSR
jgi:predicted TPR repeat methyltransferase